MPVYTYNGRDRNNQPVQGTIQADNSALALGRLREQGYEIERIRAQEQSASEHRTQPVTARAQPPQRAESLYYTVHPGIKLKETMAFFRQVSTLINAGVPIFQALSNQEAQVKNPRLRRILRDVNNRIQHGEKLSEAFSAYPSVFNEMQIEMLRAAEHGGLLEHMLARIADYQERELELRRLLSRLTLYPKLVLFIALMILGKRFFADFMPAVAKLIVGLQGYGGLDYFNDTLMFLVWLWLAGYVLFVINKLGFARLTPLQEGWERVKMATPAVGSVVRGFALSKFGRSFGVLYAAGIPMSSAIRSAARSTGNCTMQRVAEKAAYAAEHGGMVSEVFAQSGLFPHTAIDMLRTGEQTGNIDAMMAKCAEYLENEAENKAQMIATVFSVAVLLLVAILVGIAIVQFYSRYAGAATNVNGAMGGE